MSRGWCGSSVGTAAFEVLQPMLDPARDLLISPAPALDDPAAERTRTACREAAATCGLELLIDVA